MKPTLNFWALECLNISQNHDCICFLLFLGAQSGVTCYSCDSKLIQRQELSV